MAGSSCGGFGDEIEERFRKSSSQVFISGLCLSGDRLRLEIRT
jgi:hypothetical protein